MRIQSPRIAGRALPGSFVHLTCGPELPMRRPMSVMRASPANGWLDMLFKAHGKGTRMLSERRPGDVLSVMGPIGRPFRLAEYRTRPLLIGGGVGIPPMVFLAEHMKRAAPDVQPLVFMGSEVPFPFSVKPSKILVPEMPSGAIGSMPLLDDWGIPSRLASGTGMAGCFEGFVTDLVRAWLDADPTPREDIEIFACGPTPMLKAVQQLAADYALPAQISLEEFMACATGGCAGCTVLTQTDAGAAMRRVCVDGPVFDAADVVLN